MKTIRVASWIWLACALAACSSSHQKLDLGGTCSLNSDCNEPLLCKFGYCHKACVRSVDCDSGGRCVVADGVAVCQTQAESACSANGTCSVGLVCRTVDNTCRTSCSPSNDISCMAGQTCNGTLCLENSEVANPGSDAGAGAVDGAAAPDAASAAVADAAAGPDAGSASSDLPVALPDAAAPDVPLATSDAASADVSLAKPDAAADAPASSADSRVAADTSGSPDVNTSRPDAVSPPEGGGGSEIATGCAATPVSTRYFCDDFESGLSKWQLSGNDWNTTFATSRSPTRSITDTPDGMYAAGVNEVMTMATSVDLTSATAPVLTFWYKLYLSTYCSDYCCPAGDEAHVEASSDGGSTWKDLATGGPPPCTARCTCTQTSWNAASNASTWTRAQFDLAAYKGKKATIQFRLRSLTASTGGDGWYIDDVEVRELN